MIFRVDVFPTEDSERTYINLQPSEVASTVEEYKTDNAHCEIRQIVGGHTPIYIHYRNFICEDRDGQHCLNEIKLSDLLPKK